jgi:NADH dehydrogenase FAD-containing subunit
MSEKTEIVVVGGGYAGVMAANRLTRRHDAVVTLINPRPRFVERIRLHRAHRWWLADGTRRQALETRGDPARR